MSVIKLEKKLAIENEAAGKAATLTDNAIAVLEKRYLIKDEDGKLIETPEQMFKRVASHVANAELNYNDNDMTNVSTWFDRFYTIMRNLYFLPGSPVLRHFGATDGCGSACLTGDTIIHTLAGEFTIKELVGRYATGKKFPVYSCDGSMVKIGMALNPRLTQKNAKVYRIKMKVGNDIKYANGNFLRKNTNVVNGGYCEIKLTADHLVMLRDGSYKRVDELVVGDSIMPFNHAYIKGSLHIYENINTGKVQSSHFVCEKTSDYCMEKGELIHHKNRIHNDDSPENLELHTKSSHSSLHATQHNPMHTDNGRAKISELMMGNNRAVGVVRDQKFRDALSCNNGMKDPENISRSILTRAFNVLAQLEKCGAELSEENYELYKPQRTPMVSTLVSRGRIKDFNNLVIKYANDNRYAPNNHGVVSIEYVGREDVYDISVEKYHNFAANGIFIHNCFVLPIEDSRESIFGTLADAAHVQSAGGGCIAEGSTVVTTNGPKKIEDVVVGDKVYSLEEGTDRHIGVRSVAKTHIYDNDTLNIAEVKLRGNDTKLVLTDWHPCAVLTENGIEFKRTDELTVGDLLVSGEQKEWTFDKWFWLLGLIVSDGSFDETQNGTRFRLCKSNKCVVERAYETLDYHLVCKAKFGLSNDKRYKTDVWEVSMCNRGEVPQAFSRYFKENDKWKKSTTAFIPKQVWGASYSQQVSFIVGLLDGDGTYEEGKHRFSYGSASKRLIEEMKSLLSIVGLYATTCKPKDGRKPNESTMYGVNIPFYHGVVNEIAERSCRYKDTVNTLHGGLPEKFLVNPKEFFNLKGRNIRKDVIVGGHPIRITQWYSNRSLRRGHACLILHSFNSNDSVWNTWRKFLGGARRVEKITWGAKCIMRDLTVRRSATYMAATSGFPVVIHNTGYNFSRLRPTGSPVGRYGATSSGPISFMGIYDVAIGKVIAQGGVRDGAQMGILNCLSGDTLIHTINGKIKIKDLVGKRPYVYACSAKDREVHVVRANKVFISDRNRKLVRVWFDNGNYIDCTDDHRFMLSSGKFKEAKELKLGSSLMAFDRHLVGNVERYMWGVSCTKGRIRLEHRIIARDIYRCDVDYYDFNVHHKDSNPLRNHPVNIDILNRSDHAHTHVKELNRGLIEDAKHRKGKTLEEAYGKKVADRWKKNMSGTRKGRKVWNKGLSGEKYKKHYKDGFTNQYAISNHKVLKVEEIGTAKKVYDINLPKYHNFAAEEVFVHNCDHPDIFDFVKCKEVEGEMKNFNISVGISDQFMEAVMQDLEWDLEWNSGDITIQKTIQARDLWDAIIEGAWQNGEPGLVFLDTVNDNCPVQGHEPTIESTNPCLTGDTEIQTIEGPKSIESLVGTEIDVLTKLVNGDLGYRTMRNIRKTGVKPTLEVTLDNGESFCVTHNHNLYRSNMEKVMAKDLTVGDSLSPLYRYKANSKGYVKIGNGQHTILEHRLVASRWFWDDEEIPYPEYHVHHIDEDKANNVPDNLKVVEASVHNSLNMRGDNNPTIRCPECANQSRYGHSNGSYRKDIRDREIRYLRYNLSWTIKKIVEYFGSCQYTIQKRLKAIVPEPLNHKVINITEHFTVPVYNGTVDETHKYYLSAGVLSANCGEQPLPPYDACNLGSINLSKFVITSTSEPMIDWEFMAQVVEYAVRFLDNVIEVNKFPLEKIVETVLKSRRIGLGVMGFADMLIKLRIPYGSENAIRLSTQLSAFIEKHANIASHQLAKERGIPDLVKKAGMKRRNATVLSVAPTGTLSIIANCSSGIEPNFDINYEKLAIGRKLHVLPPLFKEYLEAGVAKDDMPEFMQTTKDIYMMHHVDILAAWQGYVDAGISKTINAPNNATKEEVSAAFIHAWKSQCKAVSFYRDGSRTLQALTSTSEAPPEPSVTTRRTRGDMLHGFTKRVKTGLGQVFLTLNHYESNPNDLFEIFAIIGKGGTEESCMTESIGRLISLCRKHNISIVDIVEQLKGIGGENPLVTQAGLVKSIPDAIAKTIEENFCDHKETTSSSATGSLGNKCPKCGEAELVYAEGCISCKACSYNKCGG